MSTQPYPNAQAIFYQQYEAVRRDEIVGVLLALFLGFLGIHHFYLRRTGLGILYLCIDLTIVGIFFTSFISFIECFFMPGRVREFNAVHAADIAARLGMTMPVWGQPWNVTINMPPPAPPQGSLVTCVRCRQPNQPCARFCGGCGAAL
jgi:TM2 domain-containing membrane protein YozV